MQDNIEMEDDITIPGVGPGSYTMGVKFQIRTHVDKNVIHKMYFEANKRITGIILMTGTIFLILSIYLKYTYGPAGPGTRILLVAFVIWAAGFLSPGILPKMRYQLAKRRQETGFQKMTVFENECLVYAEEFKSTRSMQFKDVSSFHKKGDFYILKWPEMTFVFRDKDFLVGDAESFESFMHKK